MKSSFHADKRSLLSPYQDQLSLASFVTFILEQVSASAIAVLTRCYNNTIAHWNLEGDECWQVDYSLDRVRKSIGLAPRHPSHMHAPYRVNIDLLIVVTLPDLLHLIRPSLDYENIPSGDPARSSSHSIWGSRFVTAARSRT